MKKMDAERIVGVEWNVREEYTYPVHIKVVCDDLKGILTEVSSVISSFDINISYAQIETIDMVATCNFVIDINNYNNLIKSHRRLDSWNLLNPLKGYATSEFDKFIHLIVDKQSDSAISKRKLE